MSLLEVLIAMFVLTVGLLGVASLIPMGGLAMVAAEQADRAGTCGRGALAEVQVRGMLDSRCWSDPAPALAGNSFAIDPLGVARGLPATLAGDTTGVTVQRISLWADPNAAIKTVMGLGQADLIFAWRDDLIFNRPEDMESPSTTSTRPMAGGAIGEPQQFEGRYSWFATVTPPASGAGAYTVSVAVCFNRSFAKRADDSPLGEHVTVADFGTGKGYGGGSIELAPVAGEDPPLKLKDEQWVMLVGTVGGRTLCQWYRVVAADTGVPTTRVTLVGPDWDVDSDSTPTAIVIDQVVGVYTSTMRP